jgi:hypothetical protein
MRSADEVPLPGYRLPLQKNRQAAKGGEREAKGDGEIGTGPLMLSSIPVEQLYLFIFAA